MSGDWTARSFLGRLPNAPSRIDVYVDEQGMGVQRVIVTSPENPPHIAVVDDDGTISHLEPVKLKDTE